MVLILAVIGRPLRTSTKGKFPCEYLKGTLEVMNYGKNYFESELY